MVQVMATLGMMYPARGGLVGGEMKGCYLKSGGLHPLGGNIIPPPSSSATCQHAEKPQNI